MAKTEVLSLRQELTAKQREGKWEDSLAPLKRKYEEVEEAGKRFARFFLEFAHGYYLAWSEANEMDGSQDDRSRRVKQLNDEIGVGDKSEAWISNIRTIGAQAPWMMKNAEMLPRSPDSLKLLAVSGRNGNEKEVIALLAKGTINAETSITETRAALGKQPRVHVAHSTGYSGTLMFADKNEATRIFAEVLTTTKARIRFPDNNGRDRLKTLLRERWKKVSRRVSVGK